MRRWLSNRHIARMPLLVLSLLIFFAMVLLPTVEAAADPPNPEEIKAINWYPNWVADNCTPDSSPSVGADGTINITSIVKKYNLQSAMIQKVRDNSPLAAYKTNEPPVTPGSTMKLIIADVALQSRLNLDKTVSVGRDVFYDGSNDLGESNIKLREALIIMLNRSSNVAANVLMKAMGGVGTFTEKAHNYGYSNTDVGGYYDPGNDGKNTSTIGDEVKAMNHIFTANGDDYQIAQNALKEAARSDNYYGVNDIANKWAGTSRVAGNVGLFNVNGSQYVIGLYLNGASNSSKKIIKNASADLEASIRKTANTSPAPDDACCPPAGGGGVTSLSGKDNIEKTINYFLQQGLSLAQAAGVAANFAWETGGGEAIDPLVSGEDPSNPTGAGWGVAQWTPPSKYVEDKRVIGITGSDSDLKTQLDVVWAEMNGKGNHFSNVVDRLKKINDPGDAANYFRTYFEGCDTANTSCTGKRPETAREFFNKYNGGSLSGGSFIAGGDSTCGAEGTAQKGTLDAAVAAAKQLSDMKVGYILGGLHGPGQLDITNPSKLRKAGMDCSSSTTWVLHQAGMFSSSAVVSGDLESWGQAGKGEHMTVWANADHVFIEFNVPGVGHYRMDTSGGPGDIPSTTPGATGVGPRFFEWGSRSTSGFTPRHWPGT